MFVTANKPEAPDYKKKLTLWQIITSVLAAAVGVQSNANRERDFSQAKPATYIVAGIIFTALFVLSLVLIVRMVLGGLPS